MSSSSNEIAMHVSLDHVQIVAPSAQVASAATKDSGRVKVGGMCIRFKSASSSTKDTGRVKIGGMCIRY